MRGRQGPWLVTLPTVFQLAAAGLADPWPEWFGGGAGRTWRTCRCCCAGRFQGGSSLLAALWCSCSEAGPGGPRRLWPPRLRPPILGILTYLKMEGERRDQASNFLSQRRGHDRWTQKEVIQFLHSLTAAGGPSSTARQRIRFASASLMDRRGPSRFRTLFSQDSLCPRAAFFVAMC